MKKKKLNIIQISLYKLIYIKKKNLKKHNKKKKK